VGQSGRPIVSVVIIFLNEAKFLSEAIDSVCAQTFTDWELVLVDDGSTDGSSELAQERAAAEPDRIRYLDHPGHATMGMSASRNRGVRAAAGRYVGYLDGDDVWLPQKLDGQLALMAANPGVGIVYGPLIRWYSWTGRPEDAGRDDEYGIHGIGYTVRPPQLFQPPELVALFIRHKDLVPSGALFERELFLEVGGAENDFVDNYEDAVAFAKLCSRTPALCAERSWYLYRQYPSAADRADRVRNGPAGDRPRGSSARLRFLEWVEGYLERERLDDVALAAALRDARLQILRPRTHRLLRALQRGRRLAAVHRGRGPALELGDSGRERAR